VIQAEQRDELKKYLEDYGIGTSIHYPIPIHLQKAAHSLGYQTGSFPVVERQAQHILSLPIYPELKIEELQYIVDKIKQFYGEN
jgi:dTDP-4-amino-4,6-dideoxygalactose transaminase